jgi:hypothetical protein
MMKYLVETTGKFMFLCPESLQEVHSRRPTVVQSTSFIQGRTAAGAIRVLAELKPEATDAEFAKYWAEANGDAALAVESFKSKFAAEVELKDEKKDEKAKGKKDKAPKGE